MNRIHLCGVGLLNLLLAVFKIGVDGAWWRVFLFLTVAAFCRFPFARATGTSLEESNTQITRRSLGKSHE